MRPMPGDELEPNPTFLATRAITIEGNASISLALAAADGIRPRRILRL